MGSRGLGVVCFPFGKTQVGKLWVRAFCASVTVLPHSLTPLSLIMSMFGTSALVLQVLILYFGLLALGQ